MDVALAAGLGAASALAFAVCLSAISTPPKFEERVEAVAATADRAEKLLKPVRDGGAFSADAICNRGAVDQGKLIMALVEAEAGQARMVVDSLETRLEPTPDDTSRLMPIRVRFTVTGSYDSAIALLAVLSRHRPQVFADSLNLTPKVSTVTLSFSGRVFCSV